MSKTIELNEYIYCLLIEKDLNNFTITTLRDRLLALTLVYKTPAEARVFVYRQVASLAKRKLLVRDKNPSPKRAQYSKTLLFKTSAFIKLQKHPTTELLSSKTSRNTKCFETELAQAKKIHETEILMVVSEIEEYQRLMNKFPESRGPILQFHDKGQMKLLSLKGKLAALNNIQLVK
ncbi:MAG TPA: hypothetical protein DEO86_18045 [Colwellia sp.]|nr:hypothetical protein [Colwellia sp.]|tara:strand:+ start:1980 stop:2510 length:531 start_codon:yes stop_codon:yes gene_type:complete